MVRAGSLYFAIFISFISAILLSSLIVLTWHNNMYITTQIEREQVESNCRSGILFALKDSTLSFSGNEDSVSLYGDEDRKDMVYMKKRAWGVYEIVESKAQAYGYKASRIALVGSDLRSGDSTALYMADLDRYLSVSGNTNLIGTCFLPKIGLRRAYIEGQSFTGEKIIDGKVKTSTSYLPILHTKILESNKVYFRDTLPEDDSIIDFSTIEGMDSLEQSFKNRTITLVSKNEIILNNIKLRGNIRILSLREIYVTEKASLENVILYAPSIFFNQKFKGQLQAFAQDSMIVGENCDFRFPSTLGIINENINGISLDIMRNTKLVGCIFLSQESVASNKPILRIDKNVIIHGQAYCPGIVEILGKVEGSLYCESFTLRTSSAFYENHLLNVTIDNSALSPYFSGSFILPKYSSTKIIQWLN
jgi:hypothetical protein